MCMLLTNGAGYRVTMGDGAHVADKQQTSEDALLSCVCRAADALQLQLCPPAEE